MDLKDQMAIAIKAEAARRGATRGTCAGLYAIAIGAAHSCGVSYWLPINEALSARFGKDGMIAVKTLAWKIHDSAASALAATA